MEPSVPGTSKSSSPASPDLSVSRRLTRGRKRRRISSESSSDIDSVLPENILEVEKNLHASAVKNNLDDVSVKKILKKVVTNDHVLALVKLREEEENKAMEEENMQPKLTRAKVKELKKVSPKTAWNLENMELTPIKHIPVKTRPEVKALIAQELQDDEDDDEYQPTHDDVPSDDDHTLESSSDVDSQPRTPATPRTASPRVFKDGPFKVPQTVTPRRKLDMDEDATIARRTRSKLSLSSIPIDHIESSFVPPDEPPMPVPDDVWTEFLQECLNPETEEVDDDDDPEYNVHADPDSHDEDEEGLENIIEISKKELNDLVTELFNVMPEYLGDEVLSGKLGSEAPQDTGTNGQISTCWEGKQEALSDEETIIIVEEMQPREKRMSIGKSEPVSEDECESEKENQQSTIKLLKPHPVTMSVVEGSANAFPPSSSVPAPAPLQNLLVTQSTLTVQVEQGVKVLPEQIEILQQQLRQHVQLAASNFLQLFVHPVHWSLAPAYKEYLETLTKISRENPKSVTNVCNLKPGLELVTTWEKTVSANTEENTKMVEFIQKQVERSRRRAAQNSLYVGDFHNTFLNVVANSPVFLYPHLLPPLPYRSDSNRRFSYLKSEDELIALGIDEFWQYVEENPQIYQTRTPINTPYRWGLVTAVSLVCKHMLPWMLPKSLLSHIKHIRKAKDADNPINKFFDKREVTPVNHVLMPFNPKLTLYEQPEHEMPRLWVRYLAKTSKRFRSHYYRRTGLNKITGNPPVGIPVTPGDAVRPPTKDPLPIYFKDPPSRPKPTKITPKPAQDRYDLEVVPNTTTETTASTETTNVLYSVIQTPAGAYLIPLSMLTSTVDTASTPICSSQVQETVASNMPEQSGTNFTVTVPTAPVTAPPDPVNPANSKTVPVNVKDGMLVIAPLAPNSAPIVAPVVTFDHCECCVRLRRITERQSLITDYFTSPKQRSCPCKEKRSVKYPKITKRFRLLAENYKSKTVHPWKKLLERIKTLGANLMSDNDVSVENVTYDSEDIAAVTSFQLKLTIRTMLVKNCWMKKKLHTCLSRFDPDHDSPYKALEKLEKILENECHDVYKELLGFMTMEQADKMGRYLDYFKQEHLRDLMKKVEELVSRKEMRLHILTRLHNTLTNPHLSACDLCVKILNVVPMYPALAEYVFSLFPHRRNPRDQYTRVVEIPKPVVEAMEKTTVQTANAPAKDNIEDQRTESATDKIQDATADQPTSDKEDQSVGPLAIDNLQNATADQPISDKDDQSVGPLAIDNLQNAIADQPISDKDDQSVGPLAIDNLQNATADQPTSNKDDQSVGPLAMDNLQNATADQPTSDKDDQSVGPLAIDNLQNATADQPISDKDDQNVGPLAIDNLQNATADRLTTDNIEDESMTDETQETMDYEADHSASEDDGSANNLTIVEEPEETNQTRNSNVENEHTESEIKMDTSVLITKTEVEDNSETDMSTMVMSEDDIVKAEPAEWNRDEDKLVLKVLQQCLTPEELKDKTILEIIEQKKVLQLAAESLPEKSLDDVRERMLYLLEFLVNQQ